MAMRLTARVQKRFGSSFSLDAEAEFVAGFNILFGASGAGKTSLLDCFAGLSAPDDGRIVLGERVLFDRSTKADVPVHQRCVGYVFQSQALFPHLTVGENIGFGANSSDLVAKLIREIGLGEFVERRPSELSAGQRQRAALARALASDPQLLLMDEPLAALDAATKSTIVEFLRKWNAEHLLPIVYVTHDLEEAYSLGERLMVMEEGRIIAAGAPQEVLSTPERQPIAQLAGFENQLQCQVVSEHPDQGTMSCRLSGTEVVLEAPLTRLASKNVVLGIRAGDILLAAERPRGISARNVLQGTIESLERRGVMVRLLVNVGGAKFEAHVTTGAQISLGITGGKNVWLVIKTYSCHLLNA